MQNIKGQLVNSHQLVLWNINKRYLFDLSSKGVAIPDTTYLDIDRYYPAKLLDVMDANGWDRAVLKPCISASAYRTVVITRENAIDEGARLQGNFPEEGMLIQQFAEEIPADGEMSLMFFGRNFSHAVLKTALSGDFRVQKEFGGSVRMIYPGQEIIDQVSQIFDAIPGKPDYARIDGYWKNDRFILMELELIEPVLFFAEVKSAAAEFGARLTRISSGRRATVD